MKSSIAKHLFLQLSISLALWSCPGISNAETNDKQAIPPWTIAFRFDDVQDFWLSETQRAVVELFARKGMKLSLAVLGGQIGKDENLVEVIRSNRKLLSPANHGLHAKNAADGHSLLLSQSAADTGNELLQAENSIARVFGAAAKTFIPHQNEFNQGTLKVLSGLGYTHISSACRIHNGLNDCMDPCGYAPEGPSCGTQDDFGLIHIPAGASTNWQPAPGSEVYPSERVLAEIASSIEAFCFAVVMLHPQDFSTAEYGFDPQALKSLEALLGEIELRPDSLEVVWLEEIEPRCR